MINTSQVQDTLNEQKDAISLLKKWYWITSGFYLSEFGIYVIGVYVIVTYENFERRNYGFCLDFKRFLLGY